MPSAPNVFHQYFHLNRESLLEEINYLTVKDFCKKYKIGGTLYNMYFAGKKKRVYEQGQKVITPEDLLAIKKAKRLERDEEIILFNNRVKELAKKFNVSQATIKSLVNNGFALREIEKGEMVHGRLVVKDLIKFEF